MEITAASLTGHDSAVEIRIKISSEGSNPASVRVELVEHNEIETDFIASIALIQSNPEAGEWSGKMSIDEGRPGRVVEIIQITVNEIVAPAVEGLVFMEPSGGLGAWASGRIALARLDEIAVAQSSFYEATLSATDSGPGDPIFTVVALADNIHLTRPQLVPGIQIVPLVESTLGSDVPEVLNSVLSQLGFQDGVDPVEWISKSRILRPCAAVYVPSVRSVDAQAAHLWIRDEIAAIFDLIALRRGAAPRLIAGVVGRRNKEIVSFEGSWIEGGNYAGNLMGGTISGESQRALIAQWNGVMHDPRARLWNRLFSDALADNRWDYRLFRLFNLLEGIGKEVFPKSTIVIGFDGVAKLMSDGKPHTVKQARGAVYALLRKVASTSGLDENSFSSPIGGQGSGSDLWDETRIWVEIRNEVAHRGTWDIPAGKLPDPKRSNLENDIIARAHNGSFRSGADATVRSLRNAAEQVLHLALELRL